MIYPEPRLLDAGEAALVVEFAEEVVPEANDAVLALDVALTAVAVAGIRESVPTYRSLMIHYDPLMITRSDLVARVRRALAQPAGRRGEPQHWTLPCCYDVSCGEDLQEVAALLGLSEERIVALHREGCYRVYMYGFAPGYAYLGGLSPALAISRRATLRQPHPAGGVMIGGGLCGVSTFPMPTGWYVIGRTPERLYGRERQEAFLIKPGDILRFEPVDVASFNALDARVAAGETVARRSVA